MHAQLLKKIKNKNKTTPSNLITSGNRALLLVILIKKSALVFLIEMSIAYKSPTHLLDWPVLFVWFCFVLCVCVKDTKGHYL